MGQMKLFYLISSALFIVLQYSIFLSDNSLFSYLDYNEQLVSKQIKIDLLETKNKKLKNEITKLTNNTDALETFARENYGYIKNEEIFVQILKNHGKNN